VSRFLIPDKTHWKAASLEIVVPVQETVVVDQDAVPCVICIVLRGTPKDYIETLIAEQTNADVTVTLMLRFSL
jgi:hypothetical protein